MGKERGVVVVVSDDEVVTKLPRALPDRACITHTCHSHKEPVNEVGPPASGTHCGQVGASVGTGGV